MIQSVAKGYQMIALMISAMPISVHAFLFLGFGAISISFLVEVIKFFLGGGD